MRCDGREKLHRCCSVFGKQSAKTQPEPVSGAARIVEELGARARSPQKVDAFEEGVPPENEAPSPAPAPSRVSSALAGARTGVARVTNWAERKTGLDLDRDGDVGIMGRAAMAAKGAEEAAEIDAQLQKAKAKFDELDTDKSGALEAGEIEKLAQWVFAQFHPDGEPMSPQQRDSELATLMELDTNKDGKLDFEEFGGWFAETAQQIFLYQHEQRWLQNEAEVAEIGAQLQKAKAKFD
eukprot:COSAG04_NODE_6499_length_1313_cov_3.001647_1_plen_237_part_10